jgi:hypothetical protein
MLPLIVGGMLPLLPIGPQVRPKEQARLFVRSKTNFLLPLGGSSHLGFYGRFSLVPRLFLFGMNRRLNIIDLYTAESCFHEKCYNIATCSSVCSRPEVQVQYTISSIFSSRLSAARRIDEECRHGVRYSYSRSKQRTRTDFLVRSASAIEKTHFSLQHRVDCECRLSLPVHTSLCDLFLR